MFPGETGSSDRTPMSESKPLDDLLEELDNLPDLEDEAPVDKPRPVASQINYRDFEMIGRLHQLFGCQASFEIRRNIETNLSGAAGYEATIPSDSTVPKLRVALNDWLRRIAPQADGAERQAKSPIE